MLQLSNFSSPVVGKVFMHFESSHDSLIYFSNLAVSCRLLDLILWNSAKRSDLAGAFFSTYQARIYLSMILQLVA